MSKLKYFKSFLVSIFLMMSLFLQSEASRGVDILAMGNLNSADTHSYMKTPSYVSSDNQSKILDPLQKKIDECSGDGKSKKIEVSVMLRYDQQISKEYFIEQNDDLFKDSVTDMNGFGVYSFFAYLSIEQIYKVAVLEQISSLSTIEDVLTVF